MRGVAGWVAAGACLIGLACSSAPSTGGPPGEGGCTPRADCGAFTCGARDDGCGGTVSCGTCAAGQSCEASGSGSACVALEVPASEPGLHWRGRHARLPDGDVRFGFPESGFVARFEGTEVSIELRDRSGRTHQNHLRVRIDDQPPFTLKLDPEQEHYVLARGLPHGEHTVGLTKLTEGFVGAIDFRRLELGSGKLLAPVAPTRRIVFLGDSNTAAFGILGQGPTCPYVPAEQDVEQGYAHLTAQALHAQPVLVARSGMGWLQNYDGTRTDTAADLYGRAVPFETHTWDPALDRAQAVVIFLGDNDFALGAPAEGEFVAAVGKTLATVRAANPDARIVVTLSPTLSDDYPKGAQHRTKARTSLQKAIADSGDARISLLEFAVYDAADGWGCAWHPSPAAHRKLAAALTEKLRALLGW